MVVVRGILALLILPCFLAGCGESSDEAPAHTPEVNGPGIPLTFVCENYVQGSSPSGDFLCAHNSVRANAQPAPVPPLPDLTWNEALATVAQAWAEHCTWSHNENRSSEYNARAGDNVYVGENLYISSAASVTPYEAVASWAREAAFYDYATNTCANGETCGHYTQLVWRKTLAVGCGLAFCGSVANSGFTYATLVICDYAPGGNIIGEKPY